MVRVTTGVQAANPNATLSTAAMLKLMVTQLQYQNPLNSTNSSQFMNQLTQLSSIQELTTLTSETQTMMSELGVGLGAQLLGKTVTIQAPSGSTVTGTVAGVNLSSGGSPQVVVGGTQYGVDSITNISK